MLQNQTFAIDVILNDRYQIKACLSDKPGRQTYLAQDQETQTQVILKCLSLNGQTNWDDLKLFDREAHVLQSIEHPSIPKYLDSFEIADQQSYALVQTFINARSLKEQVETGTTFTESEIQAIAHQLLEILIYLHDRHPPVVHRDIKPSNILWDRQQCYLVDFGAVQTLAAKAGETFTVVGTYGYMPPEQFGGRTTPASDLYSLGATLIYLLTSIHPADLSELDGHLKFEAATTCSSAFCHWIDHLIQPNLTQRFPSAKAALEALNYFNAPTKTLCQEFTNIIMLSDAHELQVIVPEYRLTPWIELSELCWIIVTCIVCGSLVLLLSNFFVSESWIVFVSHFLFIFPIMPILAYLISSIIGFQLRLTLKHVTLSYRLFGLEFNISVVSHISDVVSINLRESCRYTKKAHNAPSNKPIATVNADLVLCTEKERYRLRNLSQQEAEWIADQISQRLKMPITIIHIEGKPN